MVIQEKNEFKKDSNIGKKYIIKDNLVFATNYYTIAIIIGGLPAAFFFINPSYIMLAIGTIYGLVFAYLYKQKNKAIITSVSVYKYEMIFMDILLRSFKLNKSGIKEIKKLFKNKK